MFLRYFSFAPRHVTDQVAMQLQAQCNCNVRMNTFYTWKLLKICISWLDSVDFYYLHLLLHIHDYSSECMCSRRSLISKWSLWISQSASKAITIIWLVNIIQCRWAMRYCNLTLSHRRMFSLLNKHCPGTKPL